MRGFRAPKSLPSPAKIIKLTAVIVAILLVSSIVQFVVSVHALREHLSAGPQWAFPSRVYSDALTFTVGKPLPDGYLKSHLALRNYRSASRPITKPGTYALDREGFEVFTRGIRDAADPLGVRGPEHLRLALAGGRIVRVERLGGLEGIPIADTSQAPRLEPVQVALFSDDKDVRRQWVPLSSIPRVLKDAVIAAEDRRFYQHVGIDLRSNVRAMMTNVKAGGVREGASTITQQLARGLFLSRERSVFRKIREVFLALGLEILLSKDEILEMYLNSVYWGQEDAGGVAGVGEAARRYFDTPIETIELPQAALLVGMIPAPNLFSPFRNPEIAKEKRDLVLRDMVEVGVLDAEVAARTRALPVEVSAGKPKPGRFHSFTGYVREYLRSRLPAGAPEHSGLSIYTTLDPVWQAAAEEMMPRAVDELGVVADTSLEAAYVAIDPHTGEVRAMVGGRHMVPGGFNRAFQAMRQPGSAIKPVVYAAALDPERSGTKLGPASTVPDKLREFPTLEGPWRPHNDEDEYHEQVTLAKALAKSLNLATANLVEVIGPRTVTRYADRFGLRGFKPVASVGLGTNEVTLVGLTNAYTTFTNDGMRFDPSPLRAVIGPSGRPFYSVQIKRTRVIPRQTAALMTGLLEDVVIFGIANPLRRHYGFSRPVGGKTGTTNDYRDAWFIGFTPDVVAGVWVGYDQPRTLGAPASEMALPVWAKTTTRVIEGFPPTEFASDSTLEQQWIDPWNGLRATRDCPWTMRVPFQPGSVPHDTCGVDHAADWEAKFAKQNSDSIDAIVRRPEVRVRADSMSASAGP